MHYGREKKHLNGRVLDGISLKEHYERGQRLSATRIATLVNPQTGQIKEVSEEDLLSHLYDVEFYINSLPELDTVNQLLNRVKAGFRLPENLRENIIDSQNAIWLLDHMYGGKTVHIEKIDLEF